MPTEWLQLIYSKGLPLAAKRELVRVLGSPRAVLRADAGTLAEVLGKSVRGSWWSSRGGGKVKGGGKVIATVTAPASSTVAATATVTATAKYPKVDADLATLERLGGGFVGFTDPDFPPLLNQIAGAPLGLFVLGDRALLSSPQLAVVGSRTPTPSGRRTTEQFAAELCALGLTITSGMALGIDHCAHRGCLDAAGKTIAVTATGIDVVYPRTNRLLYQEIAENGLIVSEYPPGSPPRREYFPQRNRIISGLSLGTLVVEAGIRSGSLITARLAGEQGREVFAVPGSIHVPVSRGCHLLLRQGAKLVETTADIVEEIGHFFATPRRDDEVDSTAAKQRDNEVKSSPARPRDGQPHDNQPQPTAAPPGELPHLYSLIDYTPVSIDQLIQQSGLTADQVSYILMKLELDGLIAAASGGYQRLPG